MVQQETELYRIWIDMERRVASFSEMGGGTLVEFRSNEMFQEYLLDLTYRWYMFQ